MNGQPTRYLWAAGTVHRPQTGHHRDLTLKQNSPTKNPSRTPEARALNTIMINPSDWAGEAAGRAVAATRPTTWEYSETQRETIMNSPLPATQQPAS
ncbi:hypothetical protein O7623_23850 [Solwaraspora sp. WMMD791]|uniref:hypothetical protein n=1 Tax=Solwaraspora sp. WMMD791 TaxID=3016086 RepID=UPI00249A1619|nr:hypothetical protein [Solwaraspora sp. WMMD791]WFE26342.1 hypothetical protein O7623_23850 [Solwaraspora sp. WMMD791]